MFTRVNGLKVFLVHPGGPFFVNKDNGYWGIPKGLPDEGEDLEATAKREFEEETGLKAGGPLIPLGSVIQKSGKKVHCFAMEAFSDAPVDIKCNTFKMEWPPNSGNIQEFPEIDRGKFFDPESAAVKINPPQSEFLKALENYIRGTE